MIIAIDIDGNVEHKSGPLTDTMVQEIVGGNFRRLVISSFPAQREWPTFIKDEWADLFVNARAVALFLPTNDRVSKMAGQPIAGNAVLVTGDDRWK